MDNKLSKRLAEIVDALPLKKGIRVLEIGCGPGAAAREIAKRIGNGQILAIDRSAKAIQLATKSSKAEMASYPLSFRQVAIENFKLEKNEKPFDIAFAIRVGALDGRHPEIEKLALTSIANALSKRGRLFIDGGNPLKEIVLDDFK
jgi:cyclopropane fatty-acyl-phospholipid synthase-like methyltransferase